jgi:hypothetical protein
MAAEIASLTGSPSAMTEVLAKQTGIKVMMIKTNNFVTNFISTVYHLVIELARRRICSSAGR